MTTISKDELKVRLEGQEPVQLVMALGRWAYDRLHIPGSKNIENWMESVASLPLDQEIIVYCTNPACPASYRAYYQLINMGFTKISRFAGGIEEWMQAGLPMEGDMAAA